MRASRSPSACGAGASVAFLASLGWRPSAAPTHYLDGLLATGSYEGEHWLATFAVRMLEAR